MTPSFDPLDPDELANTTGCDAFEIAIDMRSQGALAPQAVPVLEAHLEACGFCRQYRDRGGQVDAALATRSAVVETTMQWQRVQQKLSEGVDRYRRAPRHVLAEMILGVIGVNLLAVAFGRPLMWSFSIGSFLAVALLFFGAYFWNLRRVRGLLEQQDLIAAYRGELKRVVMVWRRIGRFAPIVALVWLLQAARYFEPAVHGDSRAGFSLTLYLILSVANVYMFVSQYRAAGRARRELAELN